jgi:hypothetical protein
MRDVSFDDENVKYRVINHDKDDSDNDFAIGTSIAQLGHELWLL